jgi:hypothetical protein
MHQLKVSDLLFMQFHTAKLFLYQVAFFERNLQQSPALHLDILCEGLESAKSFLDLYLWLPPKSFGVTQAAKFAIVSKSPNVEPQTRELRQRLNINHVFRHLSLRIGALMGRSSGRHKNKDIFFHYEARVRKVQTWYEKMSRAISPDGTEPSPQQNRLATSASASPPTHIPSPYSSHTPEGAPPHAYPEQQQQQQQAAISGTYSQPLQQPQPQPQPFAWTTPPAQMPGDIYSDQTAALGMIPMSTYGAAYSSAPTIAFPDLMSAPGWDTLFAVPMEDTSWYLDVNQAYSGTGTSSSPPSTDGGWRDPGSL